MATGLFRHVSRDEAECQGVGPAFGGQAGDGIKHSQCFIGAAGIAQQRRLQVHCPQLAVGHFRQGFGCGADVLDALQRFRFLAGDVQRFGHAGAGHDGLRSGGEFLLGGGDEGGIGGIGTGAEPGFQCWPQRLVAAIDGQAGDVGGVDQRGDDRLGILQPVALGQSGNHGKTQGIAVAYRFVGRRIAGGDQRIGQIKTALFVAGGGALHIGDQFVRQFGQPFRIGFGDQLQRLRRAIHIAGDGAQHEQLAQQQRRGIER